MRALLLVLPALVCALVVLPAARVRAQPPTEDGDDAPPAEDDEGGGEEGEDWDEDEDEDWEEEEWEDEDYEGEDGGTPQLERPQVEPLDIGGAAGEDEESEDEDGDDEEESGDEDDEDFPEPGSAEDRLDDVGDGSDPTMPRWTTPQTVIDLHGYFRFRGQFQDNFFLNRVVDDPQTQGTDGSGGPGDVILPFALYRPREDGLPVCFNPNNDDAFQLCNQNANAYATMRLRLEPSIHLSEDVRIRMQLDILDNIVLGSTPNSFVVGPATVEGPDGTTFIDPYQRYPRTSLAPVDFATRSLEPPRSGVNSLQDSVIVRRAWAEVRNRGLGELRFGLMGSHWGLGMLANGGSGIDSDYQSDVGRLMLITRLAGIYLFATYDFVDEGLVFQERADLGGPQFDQVRLDDITQFVFGAAYRRTPEEEREILQRGGVVFNAGAYFAYRNQDLASTGANPLNLGFLFGRQNDFNDTVNGALIFQDDLGLVPRRAEAFAPDLWFQLRYGTLRVELEAAFIFGTIGNLNNDATSPRDFENLNLLQFGLAFEFEYHLLNDQLGLYFYAGYASGDSDVEGLSTVGGLQPQERTRPGTDGVDNTYSVFAFHPNYRIDLIFWRTIMRQINSAYYFRPGISYDFLRNNFGQLLGARADLVWSRASNPVQSYGNRDDLGLELDISVYFRSEDGPEVFDGFFAMISYGIFFPFGGLDFLPGVQNANDIGNAQTFRALLGVQF